MKVMGISVIRKEKKTAIRLVQTNNEVTLDAGSQVDLGLEVELDTDEESGGLVGAVIVGGTLDQLTCRRCQSSAWQRRMLLRLKRRYS